MKKIVKTKRKIFKPYIMKFMLSFIIMILITAAIITHTQNVYAAGVKEKADSEFRPFGDIVHMVTDIREMLEKMPGRITEEEFKYYDVPISDDIQLKIKEICDSYNIEMPLILAMIKHESGFDSGVLGDGEDSVGLMQIQPKWHSFRMEKLMVTDLTDPVQNVRVGADLLSELIEKGKGIEWALMAYNGGERMADQMYESGKTSIYAQKVMQYKEEINNRQEE